MRKGEIRRKRLVREIDFKIPRGKSLVISVNSDIGIDRVIVENKGGTVSVYADGHSRFEFSDKKIKAGACDFWLGNPRWKRLLEDYLDGRFWGQFGWGKLFSFRGDKRFKAAIRLEIKKLVEELEHNAARRLNRIVRNKKQP